MGSEARRFRAERSSMQVGPRTGAGYTVQRYFGGPFPRRHQKTKWVGQTKVSRVKCIWNVKIVELSYRVLGRQRISLHTLDYFGSRASQDSATAKPTGGWNDLP